MDPLRQQPNTTDPNRVNNSANSTPQPMPGEQFGAAKTRDYSALVNDFPSVPSGLSAVYVNNTGREGNHQGSITKRTISSYLRLGPIAIVLIIILVIGVLTSLYFLLGVNQNVEKAAQTPNSIAEDFEVSQTPLAGLIKDGQISLDSNQQLLVNGQLRLNNSLVLAPTGEPKDAIAGQIYYNQASNELFYFDGTNFVSLATNQAISNLGLGTLSNLNSVGAGLIIQGQTLTNTGVLSVQGQSGAVTLTAGGGIGINGLAISNTGVTGLTGTINQISVSAASGNITLSLPQNISVASAPSFAGLTLGAPLTIASGGTGNGSLVVNGVLVGNGTGPISATTAAGPGLCLVSTAGAPIFGSCTGAAAVTSLNTLSGGLTIAAGSGISVLDNGTDTITISTTSAAGVTDLNGLFGSLAIANSTAAGSTITINDATTAAKGIASFNAADFSVTAGAVSLGTVAVLKGGTGATDAANARSNLGAAASGVNTDITQLNALASVSPLAGVVYGFAPAVAGTYQFCTTAGNCVGAGGEVTTTGGTAGRIAKFTGPSTLADSLLSETATTVAVNGDLQITGIASGNGSGLTSVDAALLGGQAGSFYLNASNINAGTLAVAFGGTGAITAAGARTNLGAAASGVNNDITSMTALTAISPSSALSIGSTGQSLTLQGSATTSLSAYSGVVKTTLGFTLPTGNNSIILPNASGTVAISGTGAIVLDANGNITCPNCLTNNGSGGGSGVTSVNTFTGDVTIQAGSGITVTNLAGTITVASTGGSGVTSLNTLSGALTLANSTGAGSTVTIDDASTTQKGIAQFTAADFATTLGVVSLGASVTKQGNVFNGDGQLVQLDAVAGAATGPGQCLQSTGVGGTGSAFGACAAGGNISSGTSQTAGKIVMFDAIANQITDSIIAESGGTITVAGNLTVTGTPRLSALSTGILHANASGVLASSLVSLSADVSGTLPVANGGTGSTTAAGARTNLSAAASGTNSDITSLNAVNNISPTAALTIGSTSQSLTMQGTSISLSSYNGLFFSNLQFSSATGNATIVIPNISGTVALLERNNQTFTGTSQNFKNSSDSTTAFRIQSSASSDTLFTANTVNNRIVIGNATAATNVDSTLFVVDSASTVNLPAGINGGIIYDSTDGKFKIYEGGTYKSVCNTTDLGCGSSGAVTLQNAYDADVNSADATIALTSLDGNLILRNPSSGGVASGAALTIDQLAVGSIEGLRVESAGTGNLFTVRDTTATAQDVFKIVDGGATTLRNQTDSTAAFQIQNTAGIPVLTVDTINSQLSVRGVNSVAVVGSELAIGAGCTGTNWTGTGPWVHTPGSTANLSCSPPASVTAGATYQLIYTISGRTAGSITPGIGGQNTPVPISINSTNETQLISATTTASLVFAPSSSFDGTISNISVKLVTLTNNPVSVHNSDNSVGLEIRSGGAGLSNSFIGFNAGQSNTTGNRSTALGSGALQNNTTGDYNSALGTGALKYNTVGARNSAIGAQSLQNNTGGNENTAQGAFSLQNNLTGNFNTAQGTQALYLNTAGSGNTAVGYFAGYTSTSGNANVSGTNNTFLGYNSGPGTTTQLQNSTAIGQASVVSQNDSLVLGCINAVNGCTATTKIGIATATPGNLLSIGALTTASASAQLAVSTGGTTNSGIVVQTVAGQSSGSVLQAQDSTGAVLATLDYQGNLTVKATTINGVLTVNGHIVTGNTSGSTTAAADANAGTGATCTVSGNDTSGTITLTTGSGSWVAGAQCTITYSTGFAAAPRPVLTPTSSNFGARQPYVGSSTTTLVLNFAVADTAGSVYTFNYFNAQ